MDKYRPDTTRHGSVCKRIDCNNPRRLLVDSVSFMPERHCSTCKTSPSFLGWRSRARRRRCVHFSRRGASAGTPKYPHKTTLICKVLLYVEVRHPVPARSTHIDTGQKLPDAREAGNRSWRISRSSRDVCKRQSGQ